MVSGIPQIIVQLGRVQQQHQMFTVAKLKVSKNALAEELKLTTTR
jgi:hypothetical protein